MRATSNIHSTRQARYYNVTYGRVRANIVALEKQYYILWEWVSNLCYPACNAHAQFVNRGLPGCTYFPRYLTRGTIFGNKLRNMKRVFWFSLQLSSATFLILRRTERDMIITVYRSCNRYNWFHIISGRTLYLIDWTACVAAYWDRRLEGVREW
jgi:hypothetical protein